jgi:hypothetical protein
MYGKKLIIISEERKICFDSEDNCVKFRNRKQFDTIFEVLIKMVHLCKDAIYNAEEWGKKTCREGA